MMFLLRSAPTRCLFLFAMAVASAVTSPAAAQLDDAGLGTLDAGTPPLDGGATTATPATAADPPTALSQAPARTAPAVTPPPSTPPARGALPVASRTPSAARPRVVSPSTPARYEVSGAATGSAYSILRDFALSGVTIIPGRGWFAPTQLGNAGDVGVSVGHFFTPVRDDAAPRSLQPYLQRASRAYASVSAGGFSTKYGGAPNARNYSYVSVGAGVRAYLTPHFTVSASASYTYDVLHDALILDKQHTLAAVAGVGLRVGDALVTASCRFSARALDGRLVEPRWGATQLSAY